MCSLYIPRHGAPLPYNPPLMTSGRPTIRSHLTLALCMLLHAFTHAFVALLIPLYLLMRDDLHLGGVKPVALIVSVYGMVYFLASYPAGMLADRFNRKMLLGVGLIGNACCILLMGLTHQYWPLLGLGIMAGLFGTLFHPAANALAPAHYPHAPGMALGILGIGSGIGFFVGSQYSGWRAQTLAHTIGGLSRWQVPCVEMGLAGMVFGVLFLLVAREAQHVTSIRRDAVPMPRGTRRLTLGIALLSGCRDFAGGGTMSLLSIYLQKAHACDPRRTGWIIGSMGLLSIIATPLGVWATSGRRRLTGLATCMIVAGLILATIPMIPLAWLLVVLTVFSIFHLGSYSISEVSVIERVGPDVRGRVMGLYLTLAGTMGAVAPWIIGFWTDRLGARSYEAGSYIPVFALLALLMIFGATATRLLSRLGRPQAVTPLDLAQAAPESEPL